MFVKGDGEGDIVLGIFPGPCCAGVGGVQGAVNAQMAALAECEEVCRCGAEGVALA